MKTQLEIKVSRLVGIWEALDNAYKEAQAPKIYDEAIADSEYFIMQELPTLYHEVTSDVVKEAISELLISKDEQEKLITEFDYIDELPEEEATELVIKHNLACKRVVQAWKDFSTEYKGYCQDKITKSIEEVESRYNSANK
ncbi:hypothetical protein [Bacillus sp. XF8]|uniref:hypothetical protein n=1 Tax=Bacillus sp. XF8 TaxID=2819289 RepID=UPI001AA08B62|nr:hypothetical protein [Bacillus sp. XF8]MBO1579357.1 hypothetical protein [Bacillus sp. XF8]